MIWIAKALGLNVFVVWALAAVLVGGGFWAYGTLQYRAGRAEGARLERLSWEEEARALRQQMDAERRAAQAAIDAIERTYAEQRQSDAAALAVLEETLTEMEAHDAQDDSGSATPALPRGVVLRLDPIGR